MELKTTLTEKQKRSRIRLHLVGIKGVGMTGLAQILKARGFRVSGSDTHEKFFTDAILKRMRVPVLEHFSAKNINGVDLIISSNAYIGKRPEHIEIAAAHKKNIPILSYPDAVAQLFNNSFGIAISGTHGKSTLSAMLAVTLEKLGVDPSALIGAEVLNWKKTARVSKKKDPYFVLEADEYKKAFLKYKPKAIVITSADWDHPDVFPTPKSYSQAFVSFTKTLPSHGVLVWWGDSPAVRKVISKRKRGIRSFSYGTAGGDLRITDIAVTSQGTNFLVLYRKKRLGPFKIKLIGKQHALNAGAVIAVCLALGFAPNAIRKALYVFRGTRRRFEIVNPRCLLPNAYCPVIIDDYGHHPAEIEATIAAAREAFPKRRILTLFQPHTFSRTRALFPDFVAALRKADQPFILTTYGSAREQQGKIGSKELAKALSCPHFDTHRDAVLSLKKTLEPRDVVLAMGAGDQWRIAQTLSKYVHIEKRKKR